MVTGSGAVLSPPDGLGVCLGDSHFAAAFTVASVSAWNALGKQSHASTY